MNRAISLSVLLAMIILLGSMLFQVIAPFLLPLFLAAVIAVICQPINNYFLSRTKNYHAIAAGLTTTTFVAILLVPITVGTIICALELYSFETLAHSNLDGDWRKGLDQLWAKGIFPAIERVKQYLPGEFAELSEQQLQKMKDEFSTNLKSIAAYMASKTLLVASSTLETILSFLLAAAIFVTALYYFLADGMAIRTASEDMIPLPVDYQRRLQTRFAAVVRAVVTATFMAAFCQGFATAVAIQICGIGYFWVFLAIATLASLIPMVGAWIVWGPCVAWLAIQGHWTSAILLALWGGVIVSLIDNVVKMYVLQNDADLHPLLAFISVIGALEVLGLWGIFIGPIVASCLFALIQIFNEELRAMAKDRADALASATPAVTVQEGSPVATAPATVAVPSVPATSAPSKTNSSQSARSKARSKRKR